MSSAEIPDLHIHAAFTLCLFSQIQFALSALQHDTSPQGVLLFISEGYLASLHAQKLHLLC